MYPTYACMTPNFISNKILGTRKFGVESLQQIERKIFFLSKWKEKSFLLSKLKEKSSRTYFKQIPIKREA